MIVFNRLTALAAPLPEADVDTDVILPARFLLLLDKAGIGGHLFHERRFDKDGRMRPEFILNRPPWDGAQVLVAGANFGSGSSREQAVWALADFGIRCIVAPSFGEIFFANCFKNGVLPIRLDSPAHGAVMAAAVAAQTITVDLEAQALGVPGKEPIGFSIDPRRRRALLLGLDEIGAILADDLPDIERFEARRRASMPWLLASEAAQAMLAGLDEE
jgi:3-isopropylmalate/(R)-2-methylmalate dehydratase small subunit